MRRGGGFAALKGVMLRGNEEVLFRLTAAAPLPRNAPASELIINYADLASCPLTSGGEARKRGWLFGQLQFPAALVCVFGRRERGGSQMCILQEANRQDPIFCPADTRLWTEMCTEIFFRDTNGKEELEITSLVMMQRKCKLQM